MSQFESEVSRAYDRWAHQYDTDANRTRDLDAHVLRTIGVRIEGRDVLELGCGTGKNTAWLAGAARSIVALDFSAGMLARARDRVRDAHVRFMAHDIRDPWPLADGSADFVVGNLVLEHVQDLASVYHQAARVLRRGGELLFCELHPERQRLGGQAHFTDARDGAVVVVPAFRHTVPELVNGGIAAGLRLAQLGEWAEEGAGADSPPRLLSLLFEKE